MYSVTKSFGLNGLRGFAVAVEADVSGGLPAFSIVGLPDSAVRESADRVRAAIKNLGFKFPDRRITVNLAPADVRKTGPVYDLPLLLAVLTASGQLEDVPEDAAFLGELALDGTLRPVSGVLPMALAAAENGIRALLRELAEHGPTQEELERAREQVKASVLMGLESIQARMSHLGTSQLLYGSVLDQDDILDAYDAVTVPQLRQLAEQAGHVYRIFCGLTEELK